MEEKTNTFIYRGPFLDSEMTLGHLGDRKLKYGESIELTESQQNHRAIIEFIKEGKKLRNHVHRLIPIELDNQIQTIPQETEYKKSVAAKEDLVQLDNGVEANLSILDKMELNLIAKNLKIKNIVSDLQKLKGKIKIKCTSYEELKDMTKDELNDFAAKYGFNKEIKSSMSKSEMIKKIKSLA